MSDQWTPAEGDDVTITIRGRVKRIGANGHAAQVELEDGHKRWIELPANKLPTEGLVWAPTQKAAS